jgi:hypothetical protein
MKNIADTLNSNFDSVFGDKTRMICRCDVITIGADYRSSLATAYLRLCYKHERMRTPVTRHRELPDFRREIGADRLLLGVEPHAFGDVILAAVAPKICAIITPQENEQIA